MKFTKILVLVTALFMSAVFAGAQNPTPTPPKPPQVLSELENSNLKNINLQFQHDEDVINLARADEKELAAQYNGYKQTVETNHPGFTLGPDGHGGTGLVPKPPEKATIAPTAPETPAVRPGPNKSQAELKK